MGLDTGKFNQCLKSGRFGKEVKEDYQEGQGKGIKGTPTFFINYSSGGGGGGAKSGDERTFIDSEVLFGAQPFSEFQKVFEEKLAPK